MFALIASFKNCNIAPCISGVLKVAVGLIVFTGAYSFPGYTDESRSVQEKLSENPGKKSAKTSEASAAGAAENSFRDPEFELWLDLFRSDALKEGIKAETLDAVLPYIKPLKRVITRDRNQPEKVQTYASYLAARVSKWRINKGRERIAQDKATLEAAEQRFGVQSRFIAAIWGIETNYGTIDLSYSVFDAIATLAYDPRRAKRFRGELMASLHILDRGDATLDMMKSSWAGAMGQPQFMPASYQRFAIDQDGDGAKNIWTSKADIHASIAHYLKTYQWRNDQTWGRRVLLPKGGEQSLQAAQSEGLTPPGTCGPYKTMGIWRDLQDWQNLGVRKISGDDLPKRQDLPAALIIGDAGDGEGYLVYQNFCAVMRYNPSFKYALAVGLLSDEITKKDISISR